MTDKPLSAAELRLLRAVASGLLLKAGSYGAVYLQDAQTMTATRVSRQVVQELRGKGLLRTERHVRTVAFLELTEQARALLTPA